MTFLHKLTDHIINKHGDNIDNICFVLPNRRAGLYLKKYIAQKINKVIWAPSVFSIEDFVSNITGITIADQTTLLFEFYSVYKEMEGANAQPFDEFMTWGQVLLNDYNDADLNLADTESLFQYLNEAKALSLWNLEGSPLTDHENKYLKFYNSLSRYYKRFVSLLLSKNTGYQGLVYKTAAENIVEYSQSPTFQNIIFAGFNAITASEEKIIKALTASGKAEIFWDAEKYYLENEVQEAGTFLRKYRKYWKLKEFNWIEDHFAEDAKNITITGVPLKIGQTVLAGTLLSELDDDKANSENTALVLADESLLVPMLYSIPENVKDINITMGYPLSSSTAHSLFMNIFTLHENSQKYSSGKTVRFYYKDIINLLSHPYFQMLGATAGKTSWVEEILLDIKNSNRIFYKYNDIVAQIKNPEISSLFEKTIETPDDILNRFTSVIGLVRDTLISDNKTKNNTGGFDLEYLFHYAVIITKIKNLFKKYGFINDIKTLRKIFSGIAETATMPFYGEPLKGLQIMGMLETRALDFENIIILSVNEGILPAGRFQSTFIPYDIKKEMGLNTYKQKESIFAYHFYRLLQRAKNIHIIYNTQTDDFGSGEKSRFITQIVEELPRYNSKINIKENLLINDPPAQKDHSISVNKSPEIIEALLKHAEKGYSPSAVNTYISCQLRFYFQYVEGIKEAEETTETIDAATLGSVVHYVMQKLYDSVKNKQLLQSDIKSMSHQVEVLTKEGFATYYPNGDVNYGKNLLIVKVANKFLNNFLKQEALLIEKLNQSKQALTVIMLEELLETSVQVRLQDDKTIPVKITGYIDRIDYAGETVRIIDYKTGVVKKEELKFDSWDQLLNDSKYAKSLQLLMYAYLYSKENKTENLNAGIITFRSLSKGFMPVCCPGSNNNIIDEAAIGKFEEILFSIISSVFNTEIPFVQTDDTKKCNICPFAGICIR
jgi:hypothetical protein